MSPCLRGKLIFSHRLFFCLLLAALWALANSSAQSASWFFIATGDSHAGAAKPEVFARIIQDANQRRPDFVALLGDGVEDASPPNFDLLTQACQKLLPPLHYVIGNHDVLRPGQLSDRALYLAARRRIARQVVADRTYYAFTHKGSRFLVLDTAGVREGEWGIRVSSAGQWEWLTNELQMANPVRSGMANECRSGIPSATRGQYEHLFVMMHVPPRNPLAQLVTRQNHWFADPNEAKEFESLMSRHKVYMVLTAHDHMYQQYQQGGVTYLMCGSAGGRIVAPAFVGGFYNYVEVHVSGKTIETRVLPVLEALEIEGGPQSVKVRTTRQFSAHGAQPGGTTLRLAPPMTFRWTSSDLAVGTIDERTGLFTAKAPGTTRLAIQCGVWRAEAPMTVVP